MKNYFKSIFSGMSRELGIFIIIIILMGFSNGIADSSFTNYYAEFGLTPEQRGFLETPRELPGMMIVIVLVLLASFGLGNVRIGVVASIISAVGMIGLAFFTSSYMVMIVWLCIYSLGTHLWMPVNPAIGMSLAEPGSEGKQLGRIMGIQTAATIVGALVVMLFFGLLGFRYMFLAMAIAYVISALQLLRMKNDSPRREERRIRWVFRKRYWLYYVLSILSGARKQVYMTFAAWVIVQIYDQPTEVFALLSIIGSVLGVIINPLIGKMIDKLGEKKSFRIEAVAIIFVSLIYVFSAPLTTLLKLPSIVSLGLIFFSYIFDRMIVNISIARNTYLKKIAISDDDITPTLSLGVSLDHVVTIGAAALFGLVWTRLGYEYVFVGSAIIGAMIFLFSGMVRIPEKKTEQGTA